MIRSRKLALVAVGALVLHGLGACTSETELNPQPLPPGTPENGSPTAGGSSEGDNAPPRGGGEPPAPALDGADAEAGTDAADGGAD